MDDNHCSDGCHFGDHDRPLTEVERLRTALAESVKLQSHYAKLLNAHDGGKRLQFASVDEWLERLEKVWA